MPNPDYVITAVRYDDDHSRITHVKRGAYDNEENHFSTPVKTDRETVVESIEDEEQHYTVVENDEGTYDWGDEVEVMEVGGEKFIRTDGNNEDSDNLGGLPEF